MSSKGSIFISYRRSDAPAFTGRIYDRLVIEFGREQVVMDVDTIPLGVDFAVFLDQAVSQCQVLLVIIGKTWATVTEASGDRRLDNPDDFVRIEVESALNRGIHVIPVLLDGARMPKRSQLPESLHPLVHRNGMEVGHNPRFHADMDRLVKGLQSLLHAVALAPAPLSREHSVTEVYLARRKDLMNIIRAARKASQPGESIVEDLENAVTLEMVMIPGGTFLMGSPEDERERQGVEGPQHKVTISPFLMGMYPVTQSQWRAVMPMHRLSQKYFLFVREKSRFKGENLPVESVSWHDAVEFCQRLSKHTGKEYRLPSEAEWEYACRADTTTPFCSGESLSKEQANFRSNKTTVVGCYPANSFGLYDMHGNVFEWCEDHWHSNYRGAPLDGSAWLADKTDAGRVVRGGSWRSKRSNCRSAFRDVISPNLTNPTVGFRVSCVGPRATQEPWALLVQIPPS